MAIKRTPSGVLEKTGSAPQMERQPDRQRDHQHRERIAAEHYAGHLIGLALVLLTEHVIEHRRGQRHREHQERDPGRLQGQQPDGDPKGDAPRQQIEQVALERQPQMIQLPFHQADAESKQHQGHRYLAEQGGAGHQIVRQRDLQVGHQQPRQGRPQHGAAQPEPARGIGREDEHAHREVEQVGEHEQYDDGAELLLAKGQHHQWDAEVACVAKHGGQDQRRSLYALEFEQGEQQTWQQYHQGPSRDKRQVGRQIQRVFHQRREDQRRGEELYVGPVDVTEFGSPAQPPVEGAEARHRKHRNDDIEQCTEHGESVLEFAGGASHQHHGIQGDLQGAVADPELAVRDGAGELHGALHHGGQGQGLAVGELDHGQVVVQPELALVLLPPDAGAAATVEIEHHLAGAVARLLEAFLVGLAEFNPELDLVGIVLAPELGLVVRRESLGELQPLGGVPGKGRQPDHHPLVGLGGVTGQGEGVVLIEIAIHVRQADLGLEDGCLERHRNREHLI